MGYVDEVVRMRRYVDVAEAIRVLKAEEPWGLDSSDCLVGQISGDRITGDYLSRAGIDLKERWRGDGELRHQFIRATWAPGFEYPRPTKKAAKLRAQIHAALLQGEAR